MPRRILIVANPRAGLRRRGGLPEACAREIVASGHLAEIAVTTGPGDAGRIAREAAAAYDVVAALGGDGTVGQVAGGLLGSRTALGILPAGTRNVLARELGLPLSPRRTASALGALPIAPFFLGRAAGRPFMLCVSAGVDAMLLREAEKISPGRITVPAQLRALWRVMGRAEWPVVRVGSEEEEGEGAVVIVSNASRYAVVFRPAPPGGLERPTLTVTLLGSRTGRGLLSAYAAMILGRHVRRRDVRVWSTSAVSLRGEGTPVPYERDGDDEGRLPLDALAEPEPVLVVAPRRGGRGDREGKSRS